MAITKVTGALVDIGDLDLTNVGTLHLDSIVSDASPAAITIGYGSADILTVNGLTTFNENVTVTRSGTTKLILTDSSSPETLTEIMSSNGVTTIAADTGNVQSGSNIHFEVDGTEYMRIDSDGDVSIPAGGLTITTDDNTSQLTLTSTDDDASVGPRMDLTRNSGSPAASDTLGAIRWLGEDDADNSLSYAHIHAYIDDPSDGSEDGKFEIDVRKAGTSRSRLKMDSSETVFNEESIDVNFRVESNGNANMIFVDAGDDHVNFGTATDHGGKVNIETTGNNTNLALVCTDTDTSSGPILDLTRDAGNVPSDGDVMGVIRFRNDNSDLVMHNYATIETRAVDVSAGTEDGRLEIQTIFAGDVVSRINLTHEETVLNDNSKELNFRVESDSNTHMLFVDGDDDHVGIGTAEKTFNSNTAQSFIVSGGSTGSTSPIAMIVDGDGSVEGESTILELSFTGDDAFSAARYATFRDQGGTQGTISGTGDGTVDYNTSSDERLKEDIQDTASKWDALKALKVRDFKWKRSGNSDTGFIAQELNEHWPSAVSEGGEDVTQKPWFINYARLTPLLTKALQEAMEKIETLEAKVKVLEEA